MENSGQFKINADLFNQIKSERSSPKDAAQSDELISDSRGIETDDSVGVIGNVREEHATTTAYPLKKLHTEGTRAVRSRHYLPAQEEDAEEQTGEDDVKEYVKPENNKYSSNRRF